MDSEEQIEKTSTPSPVNIAKLCGFSVYDPLSDETFERYRNIMSPETLEDYSRTTYERIADNFYDEENPTWDDLQEVMRDKLRRSVVIAGFIRHIIQGSFVVVCSYDSFVVEMEQSDVKKLLREIRQYGCRLKEDSKNIVAKFSRIKENPWSNN